MELFGEAAGEFIFETGFLVLFEIIGGRSVAGGDPKLATFQYLFQRRLRLRASGQGNNADENIQQCQTAYATLGNAHRFGHVSVQLYLKE